MADEQGTRKLPQQTEGFLIAHQQALETVLPPSQRSTAYQMDPTYALPTLPGTPPDYRESRDRSFDLIMASQDQQILKLTQDNLKLKGRLNSNNSFKRTLIKAFEGLDKQAQLGVIVIMATPVVASVLTILILLLHLAFPHADGGPYVTH